MDTKTIAHYEILSSIGEGGMGVVYRAVDIRLGRPAAVKLLRHEAATGSEARKRFIQEARAASALNHPHIITIYEIGQDAGVDFIAMEYVAGRTLASLLGQRRLAVDEALRYAIQIADAMSAAHGAGIVHRDLKPGNIMITERDQIKILDFGVAKLTESAELEAMDDQHSTESRRGPDLQTAEGTVLGTTSYMSPEQTEGRPADARSDIFSFGGVLYEMVTGRRAFAGDTSMSTRAAILTRDPEAPGRIVAGLPPDLEKIIARCLRKSPDRRWQSMADLKVALEDLRDESESRRRAPADAPPLSRKRRQVAAAGLVAAALAGVAFGVWRTSRGEAEPDRPPFLKRLTSDVGRTDYPAISLDGRILAYSSDRSREGHLDIWVQHIPDGTPHQLTRDAADEIDPSFSADGSRIAFHSSRRGGGIYVIPTLGGEERLLAARGLNPRFSPDGNWIAYVVVEEGGGRLYVAPANGGPGTPVAPDFYRAHAHVWSPDSRYLLFWGQRRRDPGADGNVDWYVAAVPGGSPVATEARRVLLKEQFQASQGLPLPDVWAGPGNRILFHATVGDSSNIWQVPLKPGSAHVAGAPQRVTFGTTNETAPSVTADGRMVFVSRTIGADLWTLPIDPGTGRPSGPLSRVTEDAADDYRPTLSTNGETLVFRSRRTGHFGVVLRNLLSNAETILTRVPEDHSPAVSPDGSKVAYSHPNGDKMPIFVVGAGGGTPEQVCGDCGEVEEWSSRGDQIVYLNRRDPSGVGILNLGSGHDDAWLQHAGYGIYNPRLSSDGGWIAFNARPDRLSASRVFVARILPSGVAQEQDWIPIASEGDAPAWSPQASLLYFWSDRDGSPCLWAQRLDPATKQPAGTPLLIEHFHNRARSWRNLYLGGPGIAVARDRLVFNLGEHTGNIWITELPRGRE